MILTKKEIEKRVDDSYELPNNVLISVPKPLVTIRTSAYQHEPYIKECIEGVLMQKTDFPFEFIIGEDYSTDGTREIVREYSEKYPDVIRVFTANYNVGSKANGLRCIKASRGKYMALCEGDDYWTDPLKLQKQVDFLENNPNYNLCYHEWRYKIEIDDANQNIIDNRILEKDGTISSGRRTLTVMFRREDMNIPEGAENIKNGDMILYASLNMKGDEKLLRNIKPAVHRFHKGGIWSLQEGEYKNQEKLKTLEFIEKEFDTEKVNSNVELKKRISTHRINQNFYAHKDSSILKKLSIFNESFRSAKKGGIILKFTIKYFLFLLNLNFKKK